MSRSQLLARIMGALGGRAAEEVVFGYPEVTTGAGNDLQQVTSMARQMVTRFGMSNIGPLSSRGSRWGSFPRDVVWALALSIRRTYRFEN